MKTIGLIVAATYAKNVIGYDGKIPWSCSADLKRFKEITTGSVVIMGRKTYESIGRCLPNRVNMVVSSRSVDYWLVHEAGMADPKGLLLPNTLIRTIPEVYGSVELAVEQAKIKYPDKDIWFIGGHDIYKEAVRFVNKIEHTIIEKEFRFDDESKVVRMPDAVLNTMHSTGWVRTQLTDLCYSKLTEQDEAVLVRTATYEKYQTCQLNSGFVKVTVYSTRSQQLHMGDLVQDSSGNKWIVVKAPRGGFLWADDEVRGYDYDFELYVEKRPLMSDLPPIAKPDPLPFRLVISRFRKYEELT